MTFKTQIASDLSNILAADEVSESITYIGQDGVEIAGKAVLNVVGVSEAHWNGGESLNASAVLPKSVFSTKPQNHDRIITESGRSYYIAGLAEESFVSWNVNLITDLRVK